MYRTQQFNKVKPDMRYYFTVVGDRKANVRDRLTHKPISYLDSFEAIRIWVEKLNSMSEEEYYTYIFDLGIKPQESKDAEEWYLRAWIYETEKILVKLDLDIPETSLNQLTINNKYTEYKTSKKRGCWGDDIKKVNTKECMESKERREEEPKNDIREESKVPKKKLLRKNTSKNVESTNKAIESTIESNTQESIIESTKDIKVVKTIGDKKSTTQATKKDIEVDKADKATTMQSELDNLTQLKSDSKITFGEYVRMKRQILEKWGA